MSLKHLILTTLDRAEGGLSRVTLRLELGMQRGRPVGEIDLADALHDLRRRGLLKRTTDELTDDERWSLTAAGEKAARKL